MKITILTLFSNMFSGFLSESIIARAQKKGLVKIDIIDLRKWGIGKHKSVDDTPYGGGAGMVLKVNVVVDALRSLTSNDKSQMTNDPPSQGFGRAGKQNPKSPDVSLDYRVKKSGSRLSENILPGKRRGKITNRKTCPERKPNGSKIILLSPQGKTFNQKKARQLVNSKYDLILVCGHYEGFDERIRDYVDEEISIGDYVLTGGELPAAVITDTIVRLIPGVLGKDESSINESFEGNLLEYSQYTRPEDFEGKKVPEILKSGNHAEIAKWRKEQAIKRTKKRRPDLTNSKIKSQKSK